MVIMMLPDYAAGLISYLETVNHFGTGTYCLIAVPVLPFHYCCWAATPNYPMYTSLISIAEPYHHYPNMSSVLRRPCVSSEMIVMTG